MLAGWVEPHKAVSGLDGATLCGGGGRWLTCLAPMLFFPSIPRYIVLCTMPECPGDQHPCAPPVCAV